MRPMVEENVDEKVVESVLKQFFEQSFAERRSIGATNRP